MHAAIVQFRGPYSKVRPAKSNTLFFAHSILSYRDIINILLT